MTETAAIALMILDRCPELSPSVGRSEQQQFQRLLIWLVANVYPTFTWQCRIILNAGCNGCPAQLKKTVLSTENLYMWLNDQLSAEPYASRAANLAGRLYICVMRSWGRDMTGSRQHAEY